MKLQEYQIKLTRQESGKWVVTGYWKTDNTRPNSWSLDGCPVYFDTRKEALDFISKQSGIPE